MKTPKEWLIEVDKYGMSGHDLTVEAVKAIQLDAYKQGMSDAAEIALEFGPNDIVYNKINEACQKLKL